MKINITCLLLILFLSLSCTYTKNEVSFQPQKALDYCSFQTRRTLDELRKGGEIDYSMIPRNILKDQNSWNLRKISKEEWTAGFWPGVLWYEYQYSGNPEIRTQAEMFTNSLRDLASLPAYDHDLGFLIFCSYGNGYRLTGNPEYKDVIIEASNTLASLYNPVVETILSWPREREPNNWPHNTIMDNMINLEMLFWAAKNGGDSSLYDLAVAHANKTMLNHFRDDYTSYHVAVYDTVNGNFIKGVTHQGYADNSMWARGQAWAIYGFTVVYRETGEPEYLDFLEKITDVYINDLPDDLIPYWDFNAPYIPDEPRDASAAAIVASALLELSTIEQNDKTLLYRDYAVKMLESLSSEKYRSGNQNSSFLLHSTGHWPNNSEVDASIVYADYYYIEALNRLLEIENL